MPGGPFQFHEDAVADAHAAWKWYQDRSEAAANAFMDELDRAVEYITCFPRGGAPYLAGTRRYLLQRFPFSVIYRPTADGIQVVAVAHARRKPGYWKGRVV